MKKLLSISFASLLLVSTIGITVHKHYCDSTLVETSILPHGDDACDADMPMDHNTCEDRHDVYSVDSPLVLVAVGLDLAPAVAWVKIFRTSVTYSTINTSINSKLYADLPPPPSEPNIYTRVQSFLL